MSIVDSRGKRVKNNSIFTKFSRPHTTSLQKPSITSSPPGNNKRVYYCTSTTYWLPRKPKEHPFLKGVICRWRGTPTSISVEM